MRNALFFIALLFFLPLSNTWAYTPELCTDSLPPKGKKPKEGKNKTQYDPDFEAYLNEVIQLDVPVITCEQLKLMQQSSRGVVVLDIRSREEYNTSHIINAFWIGFDDFSIERIWAVDRNKTVVVYGSNGEQSEQIAQKLYRYGFKDVRNLYSGIFEWMYEGGKLVDQNSNPTEKVQLIDHNRLRFLKSPY